MEIDDSKKGFFTLLGMAGKDLANSSSTRFFLVVIVSVLLIPNLCNLFWPALSKWSAERLVVKLAHDPEPNSSSTALHAVGAYNLSWYYVTEGSKVSERTAAFAPNFQDYPATARDIEWHDVPYYEAVAALGNNRVLHIGCYSGPLFAWSQGPGALRDRLEQSAHMAVPVGYVVFLLLTFVGLLWLFVQISFTGPLRRLKSISARMFASDGESFNSLLGHTFAVTEVAALFQVLRSLRAEFDKLVYERLTKEHTLRKQQKQLEEEKKNITREYEQHVVQTQLSISELCTKDAEEEFLGSLGRELDSITNTNQICQRVLERLNDKFPTSVTFGAFFIISKHSKCRLEATLGFDKECIELLDDMDHQPILSEIMSAGRYLSIEKRAFNEYGLAELGVNAALQNALYLPLGFQNRYLGMLSVYHTSARVSQQERLRILRNVAELAARALHRVILYREELEAARTDPLTGLYNKKFFYEIVPQLFERASVSPQEHPISFIMIDSDDFKPINDTYGHQIGDMILKELAITIRASTRMREYGVRPGRPKDYVVRYGGEEFLVILENTSATTALEVGERIRRTVEAKVDWPGSLGRLTVSLGISTFPSDAKNIDELVILADSALYYVKEELGKNKACHSSQIPRGFRSTKYSNIGGQLGIFDPAALLQSIATAQKSGVLTVESPDGRKIWMLYELGHPIQAKLGTFAGRTAIIEFVTTFQDGKFNFQEIQTGGLKSGIKRIANLSGSWNVQRGLERCLMDAALAQDNLNWAKSIIPADNVLIRPLPESDFAPLFEELEHGPYAPLDEEKEHILAIANLAYRNENMTLTDIFRTLDHVPTAFLWRAASLMVHHKLATVVEARESTLATLKLRPLRTAEKRDNSA